MGFDTSWDIEKYKSPFECQEHWELRRSFLLAHKDKYPEDQLICLAQVFFNIELLGCRYPEETMKLVGELSEGIADSFREKKQSKLQRTFIQASDAAGAKIKGQSAASISNNNNSSTSQTSTISSSNISNPVKCNSTLSSSAVKIEDIADKTEEANTVKTNDPQNCIFSTQVFDLLSLFPGINNITILKNINENFFDHGASILHRSFSHHKITPQYDIIKRSKTNDKWECNLLIQSKVLSTSVASSKQLSKKAAIQALLNSMQEICYTLEEKIKFLTDGSTIDKNLTERVETSRIDENCVGNKMMKLMGWKGGGLGKTEQGISEPVNVQESVHRSGFGTNLTEAEVIQKIRQKLKAYAENDTDYDLLFSNDFTKEERSKLHSIAQMFHLKSRSYGSGANRRLVVSKKNKNKNFVIENLRNSGGEDERYRLIEPSGPSTSS